jgi:hypothetical protein
MTESMLSARNALDEAMRVGIPCRRPPTWYASPGMTEDLGLRHHYQVSLISPCTKVTKLTLRVRDERTTETLEKAMARAAIIGCR